MKRQEKRPEKAGNLWVDPLCDLLKGGVMAGVTAILLLFLGAVLISSGILQERWMDGTVLAVCVLASLFGGFYAVKKIGKRTLLVGLGVGVILFLLLLAAGVLAYGASSMGENGTGVLCSCAWGGGIAGILGRSQKKKRRR